MASKQPVLERAHERTEDSANCSPSPFFPVEEQAAAYWTLVSASHYCLVHGCMDGYQALVAARARLLNALPSPYDVRQTSTEGDDRYSASLHRWHYIAKLEMAVAQ